MNQNLLTLLLFFIGFSAMAQTSQCLEDPSLNFEIRDLADKHFFLIGEQHGVEQNNRTRTKILEELQSEIGIDYVLFERGQSHAYLVNQYLKTGNAELLYLNHEHPTNTELNFYEKMKQIYDRQPAGEKIQAIGLDFEHISTMIKVFNVLIPQDEEVPFTISTLVEEIKGLADKPHEYWRDYPIAEFMETSKKLFLDNTEDFYDFLGKENYQVFHDVITRPTVYHKGVFKNDEFKHRDKRMFERLVQHFEENPKARYFGFFGEQHVNTHLHDVLAHRLKADEHTNGRVITFINHYRGCDANGFNSTTRINKNAIEHAISKHEVEAFEQQFANDCPLSIVKIQGDGHMMEKLAEEFEFVVIIDCEQTLSLGGED